MFMSQEELNITSVSFKKKEAINQHTKEENVNKNVSVLAPHRGASLFTLSGEAGRHHLPYVGVVMSSCSPLLMLLMGINTIIWITNTN